MFFNLKKRGKAVKEKLEKIKQFFNKNIRWILVIICLVIFCFILEDVLDKEIERFDNMIYIWLSNIIKEPITTFAKIVTTMGAGYTIIPICIISVIYFWKKKEAKYIVVNLIIIFFSNQLLKRIVERPRPEGFRIVEELGYSFPSGHSMVSMAFYGLFIYFIYKKVKNKYIKWTSIILLSLLITLIGISRVYLGVHYASDVLAGFLLSISYLGLFTHIIKNSFSDAS